MMSGHESTSCILHLFLIFFAAPFHTYCMDSDSTVLHTQTHTVYTVYPRSFIESAPSLLA
ncbi:hypothetical protein IE53DRAFT_385677 [Violaceomyces palustris]|uniref:Uncharacterized protein n=1 Tax=Violaceomyces palustris TaxID=1673888 RepID=A0ACD0P1K8_9BASI|nr:hypothetical protein IE53DRAFT_385677 [Violaceomyces palustris]